MVLVRFAGPVAEQDAHSRQFSVGANSGHGLQRTNADKRKAVMTLIADAEWVQWSDSEIARRCGVSRDLATTVRASLADSASEKPSERTYTTKHGTEATMKVGKIGTRKLLPDRSKAAVAKRRETMRTMAADGHTSCQIAAALELNEEGCRATLRQEGIDVPADRAVWRAARHLTQSSRNTTT